MRTRIFKGIGASGGVAVGPVFVLGHDEAHAPRRRLAPDGVEAEIARFRRAVSQSDEQLRQLEERSYAPGDELTHAVVGVHRTIVRDPELLAGVEALIRKERVNAEWAIYHVVREYGERLEDLGGELGRRQRPEIEFVANRVVHHLLGTGLGIPPGLPQGAIVVAADLSAGDVILLGRGGHIAGIISERGARTSHTSIIARAHKIPAVVGVPGATSAFEVGEIAAVDGFSGTIVASPSERDLATLGEGVASMGPARRVTESDGPAARTIDGHPFRLEANIDSDEDVLVALRYGAAGVGLFRTEMLFLDRESPPTEEQQYLCYRRVLEMLGDRPCTLRTADLGGDKLPSVARGLRATDPEMGLRGIRYSLRDRDLFRTQLRAVLRAAPHGNLRLMFPLVTGVAEVREARRELEACRQELAARGMSPIPAFPVGIMVETPAAALGIDSFADDVDFLSVGTNDLVHFVLGIDRRDQDVSYLHDPLHLSVLRLLASVASAARKHELPVSVCGEMACDPIGAAALFGAGFDAFSVPPERLVTIRSILTRQRRAEINDIVAEALRTPDAKGVRARLAALVGERYSGEMMTSSLDER